jgi:hypothetical protein
MITASAVPRALTDVGPSPDVLQLTHLEPTNTDAPFASLRSPSYVLSGGFTAAFSGHDDAIKGTQLLLDYFVAAVAEGKTKE